jgi:hypothetical protein
MRIMEKNNLPVVQRTCTIRVENAVNHIMLNFRLQTHFLTALCIPTAQNQGLTLTTTKYATHLPAVRRWAAYRAHGARPQGARNHHVTRFYASSLGDKIAQP